MISGYPLSIKTSTIRGEGVCPVRTRGKSFRCGWYKKLRIFLNLGVPARTRGLSIEQVHFSDKAGQFFSTFFADIFYGRPQLWLVRKSTSIRGCPLKTSHKIKSSCPYCFNPLPRVREDTP